MNPYRPPAPLLLTLAGFTLWALAFILLYATQATGCWAGWHLVALGPMSLLRWLLVLLLGLHLGAMALLLRWLRRTEAAPGSTTQFLVRIAWYATIAAMISTLFCFIWVFWLSPCL